PVFLGLAWPPSFARLNLLEQLPTPANSSSADLHRELLQRVVVRLLGVAGEGGGFVRPVLALIHAGALGELLAGALVLGRERCIGDAREAGQCAHWVPPAQSLWRELTQIAQR